MDDDQEIATAASEPHLDGDLLRKLVLAIVAANPDPSSEESNNECVNSAMRSLLGSRYNADKRTPGLTDALRWMAEEAVREIDGPGLPRQGNLLEWLERKLAAYRGRKKLAQRAIKKFPHATTAANLQNKFSEYGLGLCGAVMLNSDVPGSLHNQALRQIGEILTPLGIAMELNNDG